MSTPAPGWYKDPGGSDGQRYWDGQAWTDELRPRDAQPSRSHPTPPAQPTTAPAHPPAQPAGPAEQPPGWYPDPWDPQQQRAWDGQRWTEHTRALTTKGRRTGLYVGIAVVAVLFIAGIVTYTQLFQRGAATPLDAAESLVLAVNNDDVLGLLRMLPPDEVDWIRDAADVALLTELSSLTTAATDDGLPVTFEVDFAPPITQGEDIAVVPIERLRITANNPQTEALLGTGGFTTNLRGDPRALVVTVQRNGRWFVSPLGTVLEIDARDRGLPTSHPPRERRGASSPAAAVETAYAGFETESFGEVIDVLDPAELQVLDHYRDLIDFQARNWAPDGDVRADVEGSTVTVRAIDYRQWDESFELDTMCWVYRNQRDCLLDAVAEEIDPWARAVLDAVLADGIPPVIIETIEQQDRHFISLGASLRSTVRPVMDRLDAPMLAAALLAPVNAPHGGQVQASPGDVVRVQLVDNWTTLQVEGWPAGEPLQGCPPSADMDVWNWEVAGSRVVVRSPEGPTGLLGGDPNLSNGDETSSPMIYIGVRGSAPVDAVEVRLNDFWGC